MANYKGMDTEAVRTLGVDLQKVADELGQAARTLGSRVSRIDWEGDDARAFKTDWWPRHLKSLERALAEIHGLGQSAKNNADEQDGIAQVSGGGAAAGSAGASAGAVGGGAAATAGNAAGSAATPLPNQWPGTPGWGEPISQAEAKAWADKRFPTVAERQNFDFNSTAGRGDGMGDDWYQCTVWPFARWAQMGYQGPRWRADGGNVAAQINADRGHDAGYNPGPSAGAVASYSYGEGHVMVVEQVIESPGKPTQIRVSEFNTSNDGSTWRVATIGEFRTDRIFTLGADGTWSSGRTNVGKITFAPFLG